MPQKTRTHPFRIPEPYRAAILSALIAGIIIHFFGLLNPVHNYDDIHAQPFGYGTGISSGRWFLFLLGEFALKYGLSYNLPWLNGIIFLVLIAIIAGFLVSTLQIQSKLSAILIGAMVVSFPAATATLFFKFTAPYYGVAILLAVMAAWVLGRFKFSLLVSALCTALSLGIYQSYTPLTIAILVLMLIRYALSDNADCYTIIKRGFYYCASLILGVILYVVLLRVLLNLTKMELSDYQGINQMGVISLQNLPALVATAFLDGIKLSSTNYAGLSTSAAVQAMYLFLNVTSIGTVVYILIKKRKSIGIIILTALLCLVFPIAANFIVVMCPDSVIYTLMLYGMVIVPCFPLVVFECLPGEHHISVPVKKWIQNCAAAAISIIILFYSYEANVSYTALYFANRQTENYFNSMVAQIRMTEGFTADKDWVFLGNIEDPLLSSMWDWETRYGGSADSISLLNSYSRPDWLENYIGYSVTLYDAFSDEGEELINELIHHEEVKAMPRWPDYGSIRVIGSSVVVKFQELAN